MREQTVCFTGHRHLPDGLQPLLLRRLKTIIQALYYKGYRYFGAGGALGFDSLAARAVLSLKEKLPEIKLILVLPCKDQTKGWDEIDKREYENILSQADKVVWLSETYYRGCMQTRNRRLVDNSSLVVSYLNEQSGGTAYTVDYAKKQGVDILPVGKY